jgi:hypothetical protein
LATGSGTLGLGDSDVAPELREFLEPQRSGWSRPTVWLGIAVAIVIVVMGWLFMRPSSGTQSRVKQPTAVTIYTYAEINAEPWATVTAVTPVNGDAAGIVGQQTPLRVKLPPGQYQVTLQGPGRESKQVQVTVPSTGGASCFAVFRKPDLNRIVGR